MATKTPLALGADGRPQQLQSGDSLGVGSIELGHASDTTLTRVSAGVVAIEGTNIVKAGAATTSGLTMATSRLLGRTTASTGAIEEISVGSGLSLSGGSLSATGGSGGKLLQMVETTSTAETSTTSSIPLDNTTPQNTEGAELITRSITPTAGTSTLEIEFSSQITTNSGAAWIIFALFKDSDASAIGIGLYYVAAVNENYPVNIRWTVSAGSTSARTYKVRWGVSAGTGYVNRLAAGSYFNGLSVLRLSIKEIGA